MSTNKYFATHGRGTLKFVETELQTQSQSIEILDSIEGKILFRTNQPVNTLQSLKTVERVCFCILFHKFKETIFDRQATVVTLIKNSLNSCRCILEDLINSIPRKSLELPLCGPLKKKFLMRLNSESIVK